MAARKLPIILVLLLAMSVGLTAARVVLVPAGAATGDSVVLAWNQQILDTIQQTRLGPTIAVRALAWEGGPGSVTPPGHWNQFAQWVARRDTNTLDKDARMFFALNNGLLDASISAWDSVRPISAVRWLYKD